MVYLVFELVMLVVARRLTATGRNALLAKLVTVTALLLVLVTFMLPLLAGTSVDNLLSYRPSFVKSHLENITFLELLFGVPGSVAIDNSFLLLLFSSGGVTAILLIACMIRSLRNAAIAGDYEVVATMLATLVLALVESFLFRPEIVLCSGFWSLSSLYASGKTLVDSPHAIAVRKLHEM